jgi:hypothetical protein
MRFRGRGRAEMQAQAEAFAAAQEELRSEFRAILEAQCRTQVTMLEAMGRLRDDVVSHDAEVVRVLELAVNVCDHVIECVEADRAERGAIVEALTTLSQSLSAPLRPISLPNGNGNGNGNRPAARVIGGRVLGGDGDLMHQPAPMIELDDEHDTMVEVRCRFGDRWVDGFEVCETIHTDAGERYRLRRRLDGTILPELFAARDIRHVETFAELEPAVEVPPARRIWSKI